MGAKLHTIRLSSAALPRIRGLTHRFQDKDVMTAILAVAFLIRIAVAIALPDQGLPDAESYRQSGQHFWHTLHIDATNIMPLYPVLIGMTTRPGQCLLDAFFSTAAIWLVYRLSFVLFADRLVSMIAAIISAIYPFFIFYAVVGLTEPLFIALLLAAFLSWYRGAFLAAAIFSVLSILTRPAIEPLVPALVAYFALGVHGLGIKATARQLLVYAAVYVALMSPWWLHNYAAYGSFVHLNLGGGFFLYAGNNPMNQSGGGIVGVDWNPIFDTISDPVARDRAYQNAAVTYIKEHPTRFAELAWTKFVRFWEFWPYASEYRKSVYAITSLLSFGPVLLLSLCYLALWGSQDFRKTLPILMLIAELTAVHCVMPSSIRYRVPIEPFLIIFASVAIRRMASATSMPLYLSWEVVSEERGPISAHTVNSQSKDPLAQA
jgi:4-amino-4-deoxy-L-arabinose transferase-like glycosyltransferase